ncbi:hypothetical protein F6X40_34525 [Paraburkholderia sp. UCT31]|uniref:hypothetical protein n=1 Tax=Paraburkholderia sp. UCT31 TaxID=2615209 RepID=UPI0016564B3F|nr:hypothetical protein [Paraburkholderia sp. UCT31]MBC8741679.1 hypothetical protein [Paraburkholderia sp. UCT31]
MGFFEALGRMVMRREAGRREKGAARLRAAEAHLEGLRREKALRETRDLLALTESDVMHTYVAALEGVTA